MTASVVNKASRGAESFRFCFTLDTEPDNLWKLASRYTLEHFAFLPDFHKRLLDAGARPTYLTTSEVVEAPRGRRAMEQCLEAGGCEIGAHFHTWTRAWPFTVPDLGDPPVPAMAHQLGQETEERMLDYTCRSLRDALGVEARSYRGGRWSLGPESARSLANCGITVDSSVTPGWSWRDPRDPRLNGPDWTRTRCEISWLTAPADNGRPAIEPGRVLEIPVGAAVFPDALRGLMRSPLARRVCRRVSRSGRVRLGHFWLRPTTMSLENMRATMKALERRGCPAWVFMIHSSEIMPCDKLPTDQAVKAFMRRCVDVTRAAIELGAEAATLTECDAWIRRNGYVS
jgi:hypothetical protein